MQAGKLRHRVAIQALSEQRDDHGGTVETWHTTRYVSARVEPLRGVEIFRAQQVDARITHRITLRYQPGITSAMRIVHDGRALHILSLGDVEERHRMIELFAQESA